MNLLSPSLIGIDLEVFMKEALKEAKAAGEEGELPIGAVLIIDGEVISRGRARHYAQQSQLMHAELRALLSGGKALWDHYRRAILFTTLEPCPMCLGAVVMADVPHVIFAAADDRVCSRQTIEANPYVRHHIQSYYGGVLEAESRALLSRYDPPKLPGLSTP